MSDIEKVVLASKRLEKLLKENFGGKGKGLHELTESSRRSLSEAVIKKLHYVATLRNKVIHEDGYDHLDDPESFDRATRYLDEHLAENESSRVGSRGFILITLSVLIILGVLAFFYWTRVS
jgi:hypothetical protein